MGNRDTTHISLFSTDIILRCSLPFKADTVIECVHLCHLHLYHDTRLRDLACGGREVDVHEDIGEQEEDPSGVGIKDQSVHAGSFSRLKVLEQPVAVALLFDSVGGSQGPGDDGSEVLAHLFIEAQIFPSDQGVELVLHQQVEEPSDR